MKIVHSIMHLLLHLHTSRYILHKFTLRKFLIPGIIVVLLFYASPYFYSNQHCDKIDAVHPRPLPSLHYNRSHINNM